MSPGDGALHRLVSSVRGDDTGAATVLVMTVVMVAALAAGVLATFSSALVCRSAAQGAADLAVIAAATAEMVGQADPCAVAAEAAARNRTSLTECQAEGAGIYSVTAERSFCTFHTSVANARAGPR